MHHNKNPQENAIFERTNQVIGSMLNIKYMSNVTFDTVSPWSKILTSIAYAVQWSYNITIQATPGKLVFGRDMLLDIDCQPNYKEVWIRKQTSISYNNKRENAKRVQHCYEIGH